MHIAIVGGNIFKDGQTSEQVTTGEIILTALLTVYFLWTLRFAIKFNTADNYFDRGQRLIHNILIWLVPFIWITILKTMTKPTPGTVDIKKTKGDGTFSESGLGIWADGQESTSGHSESH